MERLHSEREIKNDLIVKGTDPKISSFQQRKCGNFGTWLASENISNSQKMCFAYFNNSTGKIETVGIHF